MGGGGGCGYLRHELDTSVPLLIDFRQFLYDSVEKVLFKADFFFFFFFFFA